MLFKPVCIEIVNTKMDVLEDTKQSNTTKDNDEKIVYFPLNPYSFNPRGLISNQWFTPNGTIIKWRQIGLPAIFEWNEDYKFGSHYHIMPIELKEYHNGIHYWPGSKIPEPWATLYF